MASDPALLSADAERPASRARAPGAVPGDDALRLDAQLCFALYAASNLITRLYRPLLGELGLTYPQYLVLLVLWEASPRSVGDLGARLHLDSGTLTPLLKRMEAAGLLARRRDPDDERRVLADLTAAGRALQERARRIPPALGARLPFPADAIRALREAVRDLVAQLTDPDQVPVAPAPDPGAAAGPLLSPLSAHPSTRSRPMSQSMSDIPLKRIDGTPASLADYKGKVLLVVNVASKCGLTPQYEALQKLYSEKHDKGFEILGFPANNFGAQEPGTEAEIASFCSLNYGVTFPMFAKISVKGADRHPLYDALVSALPDAQGDITWNFEKFVIGKDGTVVARFSPRATPDDPELVKVIDAALAA